MDDWGKQTKGQRKRERERARKKKERNKKDENTEENIQKIQKKRTIGYCQPPEPNDVKRHKRTARLVFVDCFVFVCVEGKKKGVNKKNRKEYAEKRIETPHASAFTYLDLYKNATECISQNALVLHIRGGMRNMGEERWWRWRRVCAGKQNVCT